MKYVWIVNITETIYSKMSNEVIKEFDNLHTITPACYVYKNLIDAELDIIEGFRDRMSGEFIWEDGHFNKINDGRVETIIKKSYLTSCSVFKIVIFKAGIYK